MIRHLPAWATIIGVAAIVAGCSGGSTGDGTPSASATDTVTATATDTVSSAAPPTGSGVPATSTAPASSSGAASGPGLCTPTVLTFVVNPDNGAAGTDYFSVTATNGSKQPCVTTGYPGVALLDAAGHQVLQATRQQNGITVATVTLQPGEKATAVIAAASAAVDNSACATFPALLFTMPDNTDSTKLVHKVYACAVSVRPFVEGDTGT